MYPKLRNLEDEIAQATVAALGSVVFLTLLCAILYTRLSLQSLTQKTVTQSRSQELAADLNAAKNLLEISGGRAPSTDKSGAGVAVELLTPAFRNPLVFRLTNQVNEFPDRSRISLISRNSSNQEWIPNWTVLWQRLESNICSSWKFSEFSNFKNSFPVSSKTCQRVPEENPFAGFIQGNLEILQRPLYLSAKTSEEVVLAVTGSVLLRELNLKNTSSTSITLITSGDISIEKLRTENSSNVFLTLYSQLGSVSVDSFDPSLNICSDSSSSGNNRVHIHSASGATVGTLKKDRFFRGCDRIFLEPYWVRAKLLGLSS